MLLQRTCNMHLQNFYGSPPASQNYSFPCHKPVNLSARTSVSWRSANSNTQYTATCHKIREVPYCKLKFVFLQ